MLQSPALATPETDSDVPNWSEGMPNQFADSGTAGAGGPEESAVPAEGSNAAATMEFARNLLRVRESRGVEHGELSNLTMMLRDDKKTVAADSIKEYERGDYRPKTPKLWGLAQALDVMPIVLGPSMTQGEDAPPTSEELLYKKGSRAIRLQKLVELLTDDSRVSTFAELVNMTPAEVYAVASTEVQLTEEQLEPFLVALPSVRRPWLMSGQGAPFAAGATPPPATVVAVAPVQTPPAATEAVAPALPPKALTWPAEAYVPAPVAPLSSQPLSLAVPAVAGQPTYVPLGLGLVAEVDALLLGGAGAVTGFRLLAGAGTVPALINPDQLERLFHALRGVLDQRAGE